MIARLFSQNLATDTEAFMTTIGITDPYSAQGQPSTCAERGGIIVGIDFSPESLAALQTAAAIARRKNVAMHALTMIPSLPSYHIRPGSTASEENVEQLRIDLKMSELRDLMAFVHADRSWTTECRIGRPVPGIIETAASTGAELIVVGRHHHGIVDNMLSNETTVHLMRASTVPVLALSAALDVPRNVVAAIDFSMASIAAARYALSLMKGRGTFSMAYVQPPPELFPEGFPIASGDRFPGDIPKVFSGLVASLEPPDGVRVEHVTLTGQPAECLLNHVEGVKADLVALGSRGHSAFERLILGSVSSSVTKAAKCAVLVAPPVWTEARP